MPVLQACHGDPSIISRRRAKILHRRLDLTIVGTPDARPGLVLLLKSRYPLLQIVARNAPRAIALHEHEASVSSTHRSVAHPTAVRLLRQKSICPDLFRE